MTYKGRYAPSPSGRMHIGNVFAALLAWLDVRAAGGRLILRIEDLDPVRTSMDYAHILADDLRWLGIDWDEGFEAGEGHYCQSQRTNFYHEQFKRLEHMGFIYPCFCSRADRLAATAPHPGEESSVHTCPCRTLSCAQQAEKSLLRSPAWKVAVPDKTIVFDDGVHGRISQNLMHSCGDFIIRRADGVYAYQLAATADDGAMGVTSVVRGRDLLESAPRQIWLMTLLGWTAPHYLHVPLLIASDGRRLSKREKDMDLSVLRKRCTPEEVVGQLAFWAGLCSSSAPKQAGELIFDYQSDRISKKDVVINKTNFL